MSWLLRSLVAGVWTAEADRILSAGLDLVTKGIPANLDVVQMTGTPTTDNIVDCVSTVSDPVALGNLSTWAASPGRLQTFNTPPLPGVVINTAAVVANGSQPPALRNTFQAPQGGTGYFYVYVRADSTIQSPALTLAVNGTVVETWTPNAVVGGALSLGGTWMIARVELTGVPAGATIVATWAQQAGGTVATVNAMMQMTAVTYVEGIDPGGPFTADDPTNVAYAYGWQAGRNASSSIRYGQELDLPSLMERAHGLDVAPVGWTVQQRAQYLALRLAARHHPYKSTFASLIAQLVATEMPTFTTDQVEINEDFANYRFGVTLSIDPSGVLQTRLERLIADIQPLHLRFTGLASGALRAGPGYDPSDEAGQPV